jgi:DNA primase
MSNESFDTNQDALGRSSGDLGSGLQQSSTDDLKRTLDMRAFAYDHCERITGSPPQISARCPLHEDQRNSLSINIDSGLWYCHAGCGSGDVISFVMALHSCGFREAMAYLRQYLEDPGNRLPPCNRAPGESDRVVAPFCMTERHKIELEKCQERLLSDVYWQAFLRERRIAPEIAERYQLGAKADGETLVVPLKHVDGTIMGIRLRNRNGDRFCEPGTPLSRILYGQFTAGRICFVTEGETDCSG